MSIADTARPLSVPDRKVSQAKRGASSARRLYLLLPACAAGLLLAGQMAVTAVDPYNSHAWSTPRPVPEDSAAGLAPYLVRAVARGRYDTVMIGGSTAQSFRPADIVRRLDGTAHAANLSYRATRPADLGVVFDEIAASPSVKRVLLSLDLVYLMPATARFAQFPFHLYDGDWSEQMFRIDRQAYRLTGRILRGDDLALPEQTYRRYREGLTQKYEAWQSPDSIAREQATIEAMRAKVLEPTDKSCASLSAVTQRLVPFAKALAASGKTLDVIVPPYALNFYHWVARQQAGLLFTPDAPLEQTLLLRQCVTEAMAAIGGARVFAFDGDAWLTGDLTNFHDAGHVYKEEIYSYMLDEINAGRHRLTPATFDAYAADLRARVARFRDTRPSPPPRNGS